MVEQVSDHLNVSPRYLSDMLRSLTGQTTQQHIQAKLIEKAKDILSTSKLTFAELPISLDSNTRSLLTSFSNARQRFRRLNTGNLLTIDPENEVGLFNKGNIDLA